jgi:hypothetical protein
MDHDNKMRLTSLFMKTVRNSEESVETLKLVMNFDERKSCEDDVTMFGSLAGTAGLDAIALREALKEIR